MVDISGFRKSVNANIDGLELFCMEAQAFGLDVKFPAIDNGEIQRVDDNHSKKHHNKNGWYVVDKAGDIYFGAFGSWERGEKKSFCSVAASNITANDSALIKDRQRKMQQAADKMHADAAAKAEEIVEAAPAANADHPYLIRKKIKPHGILQRGTDLLIPAKDVHGEILTYQTISENGDKRFLKGGAKKGSFYQIGEFTPTLCVVEGFATGASVHEATGLCIMVAFDRTNLFNVASALREAHTGHYILVAGDNDRLTAGNPGEAAAKKCADSIDRCRYAIPSFMDKDLSGNPTDFNDLFNLQGAQEVRIQLGLERERIKARPLGLVDPTLIPRREFLYGTHLIRKFCSTTISPGGVGKTQVVMTDAIAMASGIQLLHDFPYEKVKAWHYNLEDPQDELMRRAVAICQHHNLDIRDLANDLFINSGREQKLIVLEKTKSGDYAKPHADELYQAIKENDISALSIDPFVRVHHADENSNKDIDEVLTIFAQIANDTNCAIDLVHHVKKSGNGETHQGNIDSARGASALAGAVRSARTLSVMSSDEAEGFGLPPAQRSWFLRIDNAKSNMSAPAEKTDWLERHSVELVNGDHVGVVSTWQAPGLFDNITHERINAVMDHLRDNFVSPDTRAAGNVFDVIVNICNVPHEKAKKVFQTWMQNGKVVKQKELHPDTRKSTFRVAPICSDLK